MRVARVALRRWLSANSSDLQGRWDATCTDRNLGGGELSEEVKLQRGRDYGRVAIAQRRKVASSSRRCSVSLGVLLV